MTIKAAAEAAAATAATTDALIAAYDETPAETLAFAQTMFIGRLFYNAPIASIRTLLGVVQSILDNAIAAAAAAADATPVAFFRKSVAETTAPLAFFQKTIETEASAP